MSFAVYNPPSQRYTFRMTDAPHLTNTILTTSLERLGVHFIAGQPHLALEKTAESPVALLRDWPAAMNPGCAWHWFHFFSDTEYALQVVVASSGLSRQPEYFLRCYYTAAQLLQEKCYKTLTELFGNLPILPALFDDALNLDSAASADARLHQLAESKPV